MPSSKCTCTGWLQPLPPFLIFHTSRVPSPEKPAGVGPVASCGAALMIRGSIWKPKPPSVLMVQGSSSVPSERPKVNSRCRAALSVACTVGSSRLRVSGIMDLPTGLPGLAGSKSAGFMLTS
ncbi:hypothetical protein D3C85_1069380 [compost metagenome]